MPASPHTVYAGTSGWAYTSWKCGFYPAKSSAARMLACYASQWNSVEVNFTFRQLPTGEQLNKWLKAGPAGLQFSFKAPQTITHFKRLRECAEMLRALGTALQPVKAANKMRLVLFQLPLNFRMDVDRPQSFLGEVAALPMRLAVEFRHKSWFTETVCVALAAHNVALRLAESDELQAPERHSANFHCYRLRRSHCDEAAIKVLMPRFRKDAKHGDVCADFMHEEPPDGPLRARAVFDEVAQ